MPKNIIKETAIDLINHCIDDVRTSPNLDFYSLAASKVYGIPYEDCLEILPDGEINTKPTAKYRQNVKMVILPFLHEMYPGEHLIDWIYGRESDDE